MKLPHNRKKNELLNTRNFLIGFILILFISLGSVPFLFYNGVVSLEETDLYISILSSLVTLSFVTVTLWTVIQNKRSVEQLEKDNFRPIAEDIVSNVIEEGIIDLEYNHNKLKEGDFEYKPLRSVQYDISYDLRDPTPLEVQNKEDPTENPPNKSFDPVWYHSFKSTYPVVAERLENYKYFEEELEKSANTLCEQLENSIEKWFETNDLDTWMVVEPGSIEQVPVDENVPLSERDHSEITVSELIDKSGTRYNELVNSIIGEMMDEFLNINSEYRPSMEANRILDSVRDDLITYLQSEAAKEINDYQSCQQNITNETEELISDLVETERELKSEYGFS